MVDAGALVRDGEGWRFEHEVDLQVPPTVEKVILARIDRLEPTGARCRRGGLGAGPHVQPAAAAGGGGRQRRAPALGELMRVDLVREGRRWPEPEYRFTHALIQETAYRTLVAEDRRRLHGKAAVWLEQHHAGREDEVAGLLAHHWLGARGRGQGHPLPDHRGRPRAPGVRARRGDRVLPGAPAAARSPRGGPRDGARALQAGARAARVVAVRRGERDVSARVRALDACRRRRSRRRRRRSASRRASCPTTPTRAPRSPGRTSSCACSCSIAWSSSGPSARSCRRSPSAGRSPTTGCDTCSTCARGSRGPMARRSRRTTWSSASSACWTPRRRARRSRSTS